MRVLRLRSIDSTNLEARRLAEQGERGPVWIVAEEQTAGQGRLGRTWVSKPGNLYATLLWPTSAPAVLMSQLSFVAALAVYDTAEPVTAANRLTLKWPNDCLLDGAKFCGILAEVVSPGLVALGIGINIAHQPEGLPYKVARLAGANLESFFQALSLNLSNWLEKWASGEGFEVIRKSWEARCAHLGKPVTIDGQPGIFAGLGPDGAMLLQPAQGAIRSIYAGDVRVEYS